MSASAPVEEQSGHTLRTPKIGYGGQAVLEGVMMRGRTHMAVAVRAPDKRIVVKSEALPRHLYGGTIQKIPLVRGMTMLWDALGLGMKALMFSADIQMSGEAADPSRNPKPADRARLSKRLAWHTPAEAARGDRGGGGDDLRHWLSFRQSPGARWPGPANRRQLAFTVEQPRR